MARAGRQIADELKVRPADIKALSNSIPSLRGLRRVGYQESYPVYSALDVDERVHRVIARLGRGED